MARPYRLAGKASPHLPTAALARAVAAEWRAQGENIDPATLILTKLANTAIDRVAPERAQDHAEMTNSPAAISSATGPIGTARTGRTAGQALGPGDRLGADPARRRVLRSPRAWCTGRSRRGAHGRRSAFRGHAILFALTALHNMMTLTGSALHGGDDGGRLHHAGGGLAGGKCR